MNSPMGGASYIEHKKDGKTHREDGPAILYSDGGEQWRVHGELHREDGPAIVHGDGSTQWYLHGKLHREDGPAVEMSDGSAKWWYRHGKLHREDGPAIELATGVKEWWKNGIQYSSYQSLVEDKRIPEKVLLQKSVVEEMPDEERQELEEKCRKVLTDFFASAITEYDNIRNPEETHEIEDVDRQEAEVFTEALEDALPLYLLREIATRFVRDPDTF